MTRALKNFFLSVGAAAFLAGRALAAHNGVPSVPIDYGKSVEEWWAGHPYNPQSPLYDPVINSPAPIENVRTQFNGNIQAAIDALPDAGGTLYFPAGTYQTNGRFHIYGRSNVHFVSDGNAVIQYSGDGGGMMGDINTCGALADDIALYNEKVFWRDPVAWDCISNPDRNFYFKNIVFDGANRAILAIHTRTAKDMLFDNVTFQNFADPQASHPGLVSGGCILDNAWFKDSHFKGNGRWALYLDGCHGCGVVNSTVEGDYGAGGFLFLTNDDFSEDFNNNGRFEPAEQRNAQYIVLHGNILSSFLYTGFSIHGQDILVSRNSATGHLTFGHFAGRCSQRYAKNGLVYYNTRLFVKDNVVDSLVGGAPKGFVQIDGESGTLDCPGPPGHTGQYTIQGNVIKSAPAGLQLAQELPPVDGPNTVSGNCVNDPACVPNSGGVSTVATPSFSPAPGTYAASVSVTLACATPGASIRYTTDGSAPTQTSTLYSGAIPLSKTTTVQAKAYASGLTPSNTALGAYTIAAPATCDATPGTNRFTGCLYDGVNFNTLIGAAPAGPALSAPVPDAGQALNMDWGLGTPDAAVGADTFSARWRGRFTFKAGTYTFTAGSDDGMRVKIDSATVYDMWFDQAAASSTFVRAFAAQTQALVEVEFYDNTEDAVARLGWTYRAPGSGDATPPTVSITAPANAAAVSGTVAVSASAADNVGVAGVRFLLDGNALGAEDTAAPYQASWNTASAANGPHVLTAIARDAAGNSATSAAVQVTVSNGGTTIARPFPIGVFEDGNITYGKSDDFGAMIDDLKAHGLDSVMFTNNSVDRDKDMLSVSDKKGLDVYFAPYYDMDRLWWPDSVPATLERARAVFHPMVDALSVHPSLKGYILGDEPGEDQSTKISLAQQAVLERDPNRLTSTVLIGVNRADVIFDAVRPKVMLLDVYPVGADNPVGDFTMTGFGYTTYDFVSYLRAVTRTKPADVPLWVILQTHKVGSGGLYSLREPTPAEVRAQNWLAIGEGATGLFWFIYSTQQDWTGLKDNPALYNEVKNLAQRVSPLKNLLGNARKAADAFTVAGGGDPYISTLVSVDGTRTYVVAVNGDCAQTRNLTLASATRQGRLKDLETSQVHDLGSAIAFAPGDGKIFELINGVSTMEGDMNGDGRVDVVDLSYLLSKWGTSDTAADINKSGTVEIVDLSRLLSRWTR